MLFKNLTTFMDEILCKLMGVDNEEERPNTIQLVGEKLVVEKTQTFKRHSISEALDNLDSPLITQTNSETRTKLGLAAGKAIADDLVVLFEDPPIKKE